MNQVTLENFRCFRDEQRARLAPLTLLVGENSEVTFARKGTAPAPTELLFGREDIEIALYVAEDASQKIRYRTGRGAWSWSEPAEPGARLLAGRNYRPLRYTYFVLREKGNLKPVGDSPSVTDEDKKSWKRLKDALEKFGQEAGLFDEIAVRPLGKRGSEPFQMQVRKRAPRAMGPMRNLIDVGYGVSQVLPVITELFRVSETPMFLLQQPEVHLHPGAQAERGNLDVRIHSLRLDGEGNILDAPPGYRGFFMAETKRSLRL